MASPAFEPGAPRRSEALGFAVFGAWLLLAASGFWNLIVVPMQAAAAQAADPRQREVVERWALQLAPPGTGAARAVLDVAACGCASDAASALAGRLRGAGIEVHEVPPGAARLPQRPEVVVLDAAGRLRYAGPSAPSLFCATGHSLAEAALAATPDAMAALVLPAECRCDEGLMTAREWASTPSA